MTENPNMESAQSKIEKSELCKQHPEKIPAYARYKMLHDLFDTFKDASRDGTSFMNLDSSVGIHPNEDGYFYAILYNGESVKVDETNFPDWVEEYSYFNNSDTPEGITEEEWESRGEKWDEMIDGQWFEYNDQQATTLLFEVISFNPSSYHSRWILDNLFLEAVGITQPHAKTDKSIL
jgi:hypothetical protein